MDRIAGKWALSVVGSAHLKQPQSCWPFPLALSRSHSALEDLVFSLMPCFDSIVQNR